MMRNWSIVDTGDIVRLTLNSPEDRNALTVKMLTELLDGINRAEKTARIIVIESRGEMFCSGASLVEVARKESRPSHPCLLTSNGGSAEAHSRGVRRAGAAFRPADSAFWDPQTS